MKRRLFVLSLILIFVLAFTTITYGLSIVDNTLSGTLSVSINSIKPSVGVHVVDPTVNIEKEGYHLSVYDKYWIDDKDNLLKAGEIFNEAQYYFVFKIKLDSTDYVISNDISVVAKGDMSATSFKLVSIDSRDGSSVATFKSSGFNLSESSDVDKKDDKDEPKEEKKEKEKKEKVKEEKVQKEKRSINLDYKVKTSTLVTILIILIGILFGLVFWLRCINLKKRKNRKRQ